MLLEWRHRGIFQLFGVDFSALDPVATVGFLGKQAVVGDHDLEIASQMDEIYMMRDGVLERQE